jgi:DNA-binding protein HU-beta
MALKITRAKPASTPSRRPAATAKPPQPPPKQAAPVTPTAKKSTPPLVTLKHLAAQLADAHTMPKKQAEAVMDDVLALLVAHLKAGDRLRLGGFATLEVKDRPARSGRNPATGATIQLAASKKIAFRPGKELKAAI